MLDQIYSRRNKNRYEHRTEDYKPSEAIESRSLSLNSHEKLAVLFSPWHGAGKFYERLEIQLTEAGWSVLQYVFSPEVLQPNINRVIESYSVIQNAIVEDLERLDQENKFKQIHLIGTSVGNLPLVLVTDKFDSFTEVSMVATASNLALSCWYGIRTVDIRDGFVEQNITEDELGVAWEKLAPKNYVKSLLNKKVNLIISKNDRVIPTEYQLEYLEALLSAGVTVRAKYTALGHYSSIIKFCLSNDLDKA